MLTMTPVYEREDNQPRRVNLNSLENLTKERTNNVVSPKSQKKIRAAINWLLHAARWKPCVKANGGAVFYFKINFITLTIHESYKHMEVAELKEQLLQPFLSYARQYWNLHNYIWKAERQKNGALHFHFTSDVFIHWRQLQRVWNMQLRSAGLLQYHKGDISKFEPNSVDIHSVYNVENLGGELAKYLAKSDEQGKKIEGRLWGCSYSLSKATGTKLIAERGTQFYDIALALIHKIPSKFIEITDKVTGLKKTIGVLLFPSARDWLDKSLGQLKQVYDEVIHQIQTGIEPVPVAAYKI